MGPDGLLSAIPWGTVTPSTLWFMTVFLFAQLIMRGKLIPSETHDREIASRDAAISHYRTQAEQWQTAWRISEDAHQETRGQLSDVTRSAEATRYLLDTMRDRFLESDNRGGEQRV